MLPNNCYALPDREEPGFRKAHKEVLSILEEERSTSRIIDLLYKELEANENNVAKEFLAFMSRECNPQRKVRFADVSYAYTFSSTDRVPFNTFSKRLITNDDPIMDDPVETTEDDSDNAWEI